MSLLFLLLLLPLRGLRRAGESLLCVLREKYAGSSAATRNPKQTQRQRRAGSPPAEAQAVAAAAVPVGLLRATASAVLTGDMRVW